MTFLIAPALKAAPAPKAAESLARWVEVRGQVISRRAFGVDGGLIFTTVTVAVHEGPPQLPVNVSFVVPGGRLSSGLELLVSDSPRFEDGDEVVLRLRQEGQSYQLGGGERAVQWLARASLSGCPDGDIPGDGYCRFDYKWAYDSMPIPYRVNPNTSDLSGEEAQITAAYSRWQSDPQSQVEFRYDGGSAATSPGLDDANTVFWTYSSENWLARAWTWVSGDKIVETDIEFNDRYQWVAGSGGFDIRTTALHEVGHGIGCAHVDDPDQRMYPYTDGTPADLGWGDLNCVRFLYPPVPRPANDRFASAAVLSGESGTITGSTLNATGEEGESKNPGVSVTHSVWFRWTAPADGLVSFDTCGSHFDTALGVYGGSQVSSLENLAGNDDSTTCPPGSMVRLPAQIGHTYMVSVDGFSGASGEFSLTFAFTQAANDDFQSAETLSGDEGEASWSNVGATGEPGEAANPGTSTIHSLWYRWRPERTALAQVDTCGSEIDSTMSVYRGDSLETARLLTGNDDDPTEICGTASRIHFLASAGTDYFISVDSYGDESGLGTLRYSLAEEPIELVIDRPQPDAVLRSGSIGSSRGSVLGIDAYTEGAVVLALVRINRSGQCRSWDGSSFSSSCESLIWHETGELMDWKWRLPSELRTSIGRRSHISHYELWAGLRDPAGSEVEVPGSEHQQVAFEVAR